MTSASLALAASHRGPAGRAALWTAAASLAVAAHAGAALLAFRHAPPAAPEPSAPPAIMLDLAPMPLAPEASEERAAPDRTDAPEVDAEVPDAMLAPAPPPPPAELPPPMELAALPAVPDLVSPAAADPPPEARAEARLPDPALAEPRPRSRPETLRRAEAPDPETEQPKPSAPSRPAAKAQVRTAKAEAAAAPQPSAGSRGASPAKWQAQLMARLERLKRYPTGARSRREEGVVQVRFTVDEFGNVRSAELVRSSGYAELDEAVLALVQRASPVPPPPPGRSPRPDRPGAVQCPMTEHGRLAIGAARKARRRVAGAIEAHPVAARWLLAGPGALLASLATMIAMPLWLPAGAAGVNDVAFPILLTPLLWAVPFFYACLEEDLVARRLVLAARGARPGGRSSPSRWRHEAASSRSRRRS